MLHFRVLDSNRSPRLRDLKELHDEEHKAWGPEGKFITRIQPGYFYLIAYDNGSPVGYAECALTTPKHKPSKPKYIEIFSFFTIPSHRRKGVMTNLIRFAKILSKRRGYGSVWIPNPSQRVRKIVKDMKAKPRTFAATRNDLKPVLSELVGISRVRGPLSIGYRRYRKAK